MDIYCPKCGEPWDHDELHSLEIPYKQASSRFRRDGCEVFDTSHGTPSEQTDRSYGLRPQEAASALYDLLGDDMDGAAAMMEDMGY